jgi:putative peptidoglycan lipid II flippase
VGFRPQWVLDLRDAGLLRIARLMLPAVVGLSAVQINIFINTFYASSCPQGSVSWLNYAYRLFHLPMGLFGVALMVATTPVVSRHAASQDLAALKGALKSSLALAFLVSLPAACGLIFLARPIIALIYQHGHFTAGDTNQTAAALSLYAVGLLAFAGVKIMVPVFYALNDTRVPVVGSFLTVAANLVFINLTLAPLQHRAIALSTSLSMVLNFLFLGGMLYRKLGDYQVRELLKTMAKVAATSLAMGLAVLFSHPVLLGWLGGGLGGQIMALGSVMGLGVALYGLVVSRLNIPEFQELLDHLKSKWSGRRQGPQV